MYVQRIGIATGVHYFQIDLGLAVLNHAMSLDWDGDELPDYVRTGEFCSCNCKKWCVCINGHTTGIAHASKKRAALMMVQYKCQMRYDSENEVVYGPSCQCW